MISGESTLKFRMASRLDEAALVLDGHEKIALFGDYDVDGVTSLTLLTTVLAAYGADVGTFLPHRVDEGYGLSLEGIER